jgi:general stress protein YciG
MRRSLLQTPSPKGAFLNPTNPSFPQPNSFLMATSQQRSTSSTNTTKPASRRGFAAMDPATQRRIASEGGKASHESGRGHQWTSEEARAAGRKGGQASRSTRSNNGSATA